MAVDSVHDKTSAASAPANKAASSLLNFASKLESSLSTNEVINSSDLQYYTDRANDPTKFPVGALTQDKAQQLESVGRRIWNVCIRKHNSADSSNKFATKSYTRERLFSFLLLGLGLLARQDANTNTSTAYLVPLGLTLSKACVNTSDLGSARISLQKVAEYLDSKSRQALRSPSESDPSTDAEYASYYILRIALSWKDDRLDLAEHMHTKATQHLPSADTATRTALVMLLSQIGHSLIARTHLDAAAPWFRRAAAAEPASRFLPTRGGACDRLPTAVEAQQELLQAARLAATNGLLKCLTGVRSCEYMEEASRVVESAAGEFGGHRLEVREMAAMVQAAMSDYNGLAASLYDIISNLSHFLEKNMSLDSVLGHIDKMRKIDTDTAAGLLDEMISQLISARAQIGTLNNAVVMRLTIFLQNPEKETIWDCFELLDCLLDSTNILNSHSAQQVHSLLWKILQPLYYEKQYTKALTWCHLGLHAALSTSAPATIAIYTRKLLACRIELGDYADALSIYDSLPPHEKNHLVTRFLLFRLAIRGWNQTLAQECLAFFAALPDKNEARDALCACIREAQTTGDKLCTIEALQTAAGTWLGEGMVAANLPSLLRCAIRLLQLVHTEHAETDTRTACETFPREITHLFQLAADFVSRKVHDAANEPIFHAAELRWFSTNSYNLGISNSTIWDPGCLASLFKTTRIFTQALAEAQSTDDAKSAVDAVDAILLSLHCHFILASLYISEARGSPNEHTESLYADVVNCAKQFHALSTRHYGSTPQRYPGLCRQYGVVQVFYFESIIFQSHWDMLPTIIQQATACKDADVLKAMGDVLITSAAPPQVMSSVLKQIINEIFALEDFKCDRLAQYLRCMVQILLPMGDDALVRQAGAAFPSEEAEWLAAATFNHGITQYSARDTTTCHSWLDLAITIAQHVQDDGTFIASLRSRQEQLANSSLPFT